MGRIVAVDASTEPSVKGPTWKENAKYFIHHIPHIINCIKVNTHTK